MSTYAIGDIQGCFDSFMSMLEHIQFDAAKDMLWLTGDLVGRGPKSLEVLQYVFKNQERIITVLGNHDLHALACYLNIKKPHPKDLIEPLLESPDAPILFDWLRKQKLLHYDKAINTLMVHAGVHPSWNLTQCMSLANEVETVLQKLRFEEFISQMYGNEPKIWDLALAGNERLRFIVNVMTRIRMLKGPNFELELDYKTALDNQNNTVQELQPWFKSPPPTMIAAG